MRTEAFPSARGAAGDPEALFCRLAVSRRKLTADQLFEARLERGRRRAAGETISLVQVLLLGGSSRRWTRNSRPQSGPPAPTSACGGTTRKAGSARS